LLDLRAGASLTRHVDLEVWGRNVTNTYYYNNVSHVVDTITRNAGMPATYGVTLRYRL